MKKNNENSEIIGERIKEKIGAEEKVKQEKIIPYLRDVLSYKLMDFEVPVRFGRMTKYADIVISIIEDHRKIPYIIIECKAPGNIKSDDWLQAESYAQRLAASYFAVTDGTKNGWFWYKTGERQGNSTIIDDVTKIPHVTVQKEGKALIKFEDLSSLSRVIQQCHDIIRNEEGRDPAESFDEMGKILFAKMKDEKDIKRKNKRKYDFKIITDNRGKVLDTVSSVADRVRELFEEAKREYPKIYAEIESKTAKKLVTINLKDHTIYQIVGIVAPYTLIDTGADQQGIDIKGSMFEIFLKGTFRGPLGQFFTPREIINFMISVVNPKDNESVLDPGCGSGGFLIGCMRKVWGDLHEKYLQGKIDDLEKIKENYAENNLFGMDINERLAWVAKANMVFHGDGHGGIAHSNALTCTTRNKFIISKKYNVILTNPPFGSKINDPRIISDPRFKEVSKSKLTEVLFLTLCIDLLKPHGRLGIVLPDGILTNTSLKFIRDHIKKETIIKSVISLPQETFMPYGSGVKTSLLFLEKKNPNDPYHEQNSVFMAIAENIGYDASGRKTRQNDLKDILEEYHKFEDKNSKRK